MEWTHFGHLRHVEAGADRIRTDAVFRELRNQGLGKMHQRGLACDIRMAYVLRPAECCQTAYRDELALNKVLLASAIRMFIPSIEKIQESHKCVVGPKDVHVDCLLGIFERHVPQLCSDVRE